MKNSVPNIHSMDPIRNHTRIRKAYTQFQTLQKESSKFNILKLNVMKI